MPLAWTLQVCLPLPVLAVRVATVMMAVAVAVALPGSPLAPGPSTGKPQHDDAVTVNKSPRASLAATVTGML